MLQLSTVILYWIASHQKSYITKKHIFATKEQRLSKLYILGPLGGL